MPSKGQERQDKEMNEKRVLLARYQELKAERAMLLDGLKDNKKERAIIQRAIASVSKDIANLEETIIKVVKNGNEKIITQPEKGDSGAVVKQ